MVVTKEVLKLDKFTDFNRRHSAKKNDKTLTDDVLKPDKSKDINDLQK